MVNAVTKVMLDLITSYRGICLLQFMKVKGIPNANPY